MRVTLALLFLPALAAAEEHWTEFRSGPFHIVTNAGAKMARERLNQLEQIRNALGHLIGKTDPQLTWPLRLALFASEQEYGRYAPAQSFSLGRDAWLSAWTAQTPLNREWLRAFVQLLLDDNTGRMAPGIERGLRDLFCTLEANGTHVTLGAPLPPGERTLDWARLEMLATNPETAGKLPVFIANVAHGGNPDAAARNAFDKPIAEIDKRAAAYLAAGQFATIELSARALNPARDFPEIPWDRADSQLLLADLLLMNPAHAVQARAAYAALKGVGSDEGLGLLAAREGKTDEARQHLAAAAAAGSKSPRVWVELAALEKDPTKERSDLEKAVPLNPKWAEPHLRLSQLGADAAARVPELKRAAQLEPRNAALWQKLAETAQEAQQFEEAEKAWAAADRAASTPEEQARITQARLDVEQKRLDFEDAERRRLAEEKARDLERVRNAALASVQQAVDNANRQMAANGGAALPAKLPEFNEAHGAKQVLGVLERVECVGHILRLTVAPETGAAMRLSIHDANRVTVIAQKAGDESALTCGASPSGRHVRVEYNEKIDAKLGVSGEAVVVEFF